MVCVGRKTMNVCERGIEEQHAMDNMSQDPSCAMMCPNACKRQHIRR